MSWTLLRVSSLIYYFMSLRYSYYWVCYDTTVYASLIDWSFHMEPEMRHTNAPKHIGSNRTGMQKFRRRKCEVCYSLTHFDTFGPIWKFQSPFLLPFSSLSGHRPDRIPSSLIPVSYHFPPLKINLSEFYVNTCVLWNHDYQNINSVLYKAHVLLLSWRYGKAMLLLGEEKIYRRMELYNWEVDFLYTDWWQLWVLDLNGLKWPTFPWFYVNTTYNY